MTDRPSERRPENPANPQVTGGGGHEPDPERDGSRDDRAREPAAGSGVDLKSEDLPEDDEG